MRQICAVFKQAKEPTCCPEVGDIALLGYLVGDSTSEVCFTCAVDAMEDQPDLASIPPFLLALREVNGKSLGDIESVLLVVWVLSCREFEGLECLIVIGQRERFVSQEKDQLLVSKVFF